MAAPILAPGKRRYSLSLTEANVEKFQEYAKRFKMPANQMSRTCDDAIREMVVLFARAEEQGAFTVKDLFRLMGEQIEMALEEERRERHEVQQKRNPVH